MPKSTKKTEAVTATPTPNVDVEVLSADSKKSASKPKVSKSKAVKNVDVVATNVETTTPTNTVVDEQESSESVLTDTFTEFMAKLQNLASQMNSLKSEFRTLEKKAVRELKTAQKINAKRKRKTGNRSPSGFVKPTLISNELANFLKKPHGTEMARTEVTREINGYIRANSLQDKENGRKINPDSHLATLLKINAGEELTYFNLQRYMSPHFAKANAKVPAVDM
uniref:DM2 domain-containing protein n=1 Tax=viral metagenome TaxID=1070528 RepID=A0A6C0AXJ9_9ZZZZ|tara:strand:- start:10 stop:681 length:672 start_codon:yes stop_codon:yes gene_type:complete